MTQLSEEQKTSLVSELLEVVGSYIVLDDEDENNELYDGFYELISDGLVRY